MTRHRTKDMRKPATYPSGNQRPKRPKPLNHLDRRTTAFRWDWVRSQRDRLLALARYRRLKPWQQQQLEQLQRLAKSYNHYLGRACARDAYEITQSLVQRGLWNP